ncbi:major facilitator superfamily domain-containing protein [Geopyxis carbonaria]|nr:major facilitator superfamily domain-containing protein [Geopyxis carbonaria]
MQAEKLKHPELESAMPEIKSSESSTGTEPDWTEEEEKVIRNRIDWYIIPVVTVLYLLCFLDRANIGNARIQGMQEELHLVGFRFNWALTIFYIPYLLIEIPSNVLLKKIGAKVYIPFLVLGFGLCSMCCAFVTDYKGLYIARAFLGVFEGGTMPGIAFFLSCFYKRKELLFRVGIFISASSMAGAFGGLFATALARIPHWGVAGMQMHTWRNIFFFEGIMTMVIAIGGYFLMPSAPTSCTFLTPRQQYIATERILREHKEAAHEKTELRHLKRAVFNINNIICAMGFFFINVTVQSFSLFLPTILKALGWTSTRAQLLTVPPYVIACMWSIFVSWLSDRWQRRGYIIFAHTLLALLGYVLLITVDSPNIKYLAVYFAAAGAYPLGPFFLSWGLNNAAGPTVRAVSGGYIVAVGTCGAILATWTYVPKDAPNYITGHSINLGAQAGAGAVALLGVAYCKWENRMRAHGKRDFRLEGLSMEEQRQLGYRHPDFKYMQ